MTNSKDWYLLNSSSNVYSGDFSGDEVNQYAQDVFNEILQVSPERYTVEIDGVATDVIIQSSNIKNDDERIMLSSIGLVKRGQIVVYKDQSWIVLSVLDDNKVHQTCILKQCNAQYKLSGQTQRTEVSRDPMGRPVYEDVPVTPDKFIPCFAEYKVYFLDNRNPINVPSNNITITLPYIEHKDVTMNANFEVFGEDYVVINVDRTKSINGVGLLVLTGQRK